MRSWPSPTGWTCFSPSSGLPSRRMPGTSCSRWSMRPETEKRLFGRRHTGAEWLILYGAIAVFAFALGVAVLAGHCLRNAFVS